jgi:general secretion pathway protein J
LKTRGFTLIEVLVALVLVSIMALLAWRGLEGMGNAATQTQSYEARSDRLRTTLAQWSADLDALIDTGLAQQLGIKALDFDGQRLRLTRRSNEAHAGVQVVAWAIQGGQLKRYAAPAAQSQTALQAAWNNAQRWARTPLPQDAALTVTLGSAVSWQLFYFRGDAWSNPLSAEAANEAMPDGVRLVLELPSDQSFGGKLTRDWMQPALGATK